MQTWNVEAERWITCEAELVGLDPEQPLRLGVHFPVEFGEGKPCDAQDDKVRINLNCPPDAERSICVELQLGENEIKVNSCWFLLFRNYS
jgi:hypothetical protein